MAPDLVLTLPMPPASLLPNHSRRLGWRRRALHVREYRELCGWELKTQVCRPIPRYQRVTMLLVFVFRSRRGPDLDNLHASFKPALDAIVDVGLLPDDSADHLPEVTVRREIQPAATPHVRVHLTELLDACNASGGGATSLKH